MSEEEIKKIVFMDLKKFVDMVIPHDDNATWSKDPSVDIRAVATSNGITDIQCVPPEVIIDKKIEPIKHGGLLGTIIFINTNDSPGKQNFLIAHEVFELLAKQPKKDLMLAVARHGETWKKENAGTPEAFREVIADYFAANLLVPTERFILWEDKSDEEIATAFGVGPECIRERRKEIEYELEIMAPKNLSSNVIPEDLAPLSLEELECVLEGHKTHDSGRP